MPITITKTTLADLLVIEPDCYKDDRGFFFESYNQANFNKAIGREIHFVQDNHSYSRKGTLRGLHYQIGKTQGKLVRVVLGSVFDVAVDLRKSSSTYGQWFGVELTADNRKQLWIPEGFAHGFLALSDHVEFLYKTTDFWDANSERCLMWNDPTVDINWPQIDGEFYLSGKDLKGLSWSELPKFN